LQQLIQWLCSCLMRLLFRSWGGCFARQWPLSLSLFSLLHIIKNPMWHRMGRPMGLMCDNVLLRTKFVAVTTTWIRWRHRCSSICHQQGSHYTGMETRPAASPAYISTWRHIVWHQRKRRPTFKRKEENEQNRRVLCWRLEIWKV
jgi:hypothetical protein